MKNVFGFLILAAWVAVGGATCGNPISESPKSDYVGLQLIVQNSLPPEQYSSGIQTPDIIVYFCASSSVDLPAGQRCMKFPGTLNNGLTGYLYVDPSALQNYASLGGGKVSVEFEDSLQVFSGVSYGCTGSNRHLPISLDYWSKQSFKIQLTARNTVTYSCVVTK